MTGIVESSDQVLQPVKTYREEELGHVKSAVTQIPQISITMSNTSSTEIKISVEPPIRNVVLNRLPIEGPEFVPEARHVSHPYFCPSHIPELRGIERARDVIIFGLKMKKNKSGNVRYERVVKIAINKKNSDGE
ncbi:hypothetical protein TNCV_2737461 [Trichonephila clavipes]|nr:hypothetical protein TNCV_2737461 [Trichonephila clavipes]